MFLKTPLKQHNNNQLIPYDELCPETCYHYNKINNHFKLVSVTPMNKLCFTFIHKLDFKIRVNTNNNNSRTVGKLNVFHCSAHINATLGTVWAVFKQTRVNK